MDRLRFFSIGSGSSGNCYYIGTGEYGFLIDAGVGIRAIKKALKERGLSMDNIWGTDHIKSVGTLGCKCFRPIYLTADMHKGIDRNYRVTEKLLPSACKYFHKGERIVIRDFEIQSFPVSHDATDSVGYSFTYGDQCFVIATDLGYINKEAANHIAKADYLVIEANYDETMLKNGPYPYPLKQRVRSHVGHLSNEHTARFLADNPSGRLTHVFLCHLSQENNTPETARRAVTEALAEKGITLEMVQPLERMQPSQVYMFRHYRPE